MDWRLNSVMKYLKNSKKTRWQIIMAAIFMVWKSFGLFLNTTKYIYNNIVCITVLCKYVSNYYICVSNYSVQVFIITVYVCVGSESV